MENMDFQTRKEEGGTRRWIHELGCGKKSCFIALWTQKRTWATVMKKNSKKVFPLKFHWDWITISVKDYKFQFSSETTMKAYVFLRKRGGKTSISFNAICYAVRKKTLVRTFKKNTNNFFSSQLDRSLSLGNISIFC